MQLEELDFPSTLGEILGYFLPLFNCPSYVTSVMRNLDEMIPRTLSSLNTLTM